MCIQRNSAHLPVFMSPGYRADALKNTRNRICSCKRRIIMLQRLFAITLLAAISGFFVTPAAKADNVVLNQWYTGQFGNVFSTPLLGGVDYALGVNGPILQPPVGPCAPTAPVGFANAVAAPDPAWVITLPCGGTLTVTDVEESGDQFALFDNGKPMTLAASPFTGPGQNPGWAGIISNGFDCGPPDGELVAAGNSCTSVPVPGASNDANDINVSLGDPNMSSGTFYLPPGENDITGEYLGVEFNGDFDFIIEPAPEPSSLVLFGTGLLGVLIVFRRKLIA
jgi:hypothetical protein